MNRLIWYILVYSFLGYLLETAYARLVRGHGGGRKCLLLLPLCPVYGAGGVVIAALCGPAAHPLEVMAVGFGAATAFQITFAMVLNVYLMIPFYMNLYGINEAGLLGVMQLANPAIKDIGWSYALFAVLPFNALKDVVVIVVTFFVYRSIHKLLRFEK